MVDRGGGRTRPRVIYQLKLTSAASYLPKCWLHPMLATDFLIIGVNISLNGKVSSTVVVRMDVSSNCCAMG